MSTVIVICGKIKEKRYVCESAALDFAATGGESSQICAWSKSGRVDQEALKLTKQYEAWLKEMYQTYGASKDGPAIYLEDQLPTYLKELETGKNSLTGEPLTNEEIRTLKARVAAAWTAAAVTPIAEMYAWYGVSKYYSEKIQNNIEKKSKEFNLDNINYEDLGKKYTPEEMINGLEKQGWEKRVESGGNKSGNATILENPQNGDKIRIHATPSNGDPYFRVQNKGGNYVDKNGQFPSDATRQELRDKTHFNFK